MDDALLLPAATILAALITSRPRGGQEMPGTELRDRFVAVYRDLQAAREIIQGDGAKGGAAAPQH
jgi:hypothetical protein